MLRIVFFLELSALFLAITIALLQEISDYDLWFSLVVGREIVRTGQVPKEEFYVFPVFGEATQFSAWGFGTTYYFIYEAVGSVGLSIVNAMLGAIALLMIHFAARETSGRSPSLIATIPILAFVLILVRDRMVFRPEITLFLALAFEFWLLEHYLRTRRPALLFPLPLLAWLLAQFHTTSLFVVIIFAVYVIHIALEDGKAFLQGRTFAFLLLVGGSAVILPFLNPYGIARTTAMFEAMGVQNDVVEYLPVLQTEWGVRFVVLMSLCLAALLVVRPRRVVDFLLVGGFGWFAFQYARNLGLFAFVAYPLLARAAMGFDRFRNVSGNWAPKAAFLLLVTLHLASIGWAMKEIRRSGTWGVGLDIEAFPEQAVHRIKAALPGGRILNFYHLGSYLAWSLGPEYSVFYDGHFLLGSQLGKRIAVLHDSVFRADHGWEQVLNSWDIRAIVTPATLIWSGRLIPLVTQLADNDEWYLAACEKTALTFFQRNLLEQPGAGPMLPKSYVWRQVVREARNTLDLYPDHAPAHEAVATALDRLGDPAGALTEWKTCLRYDPGNVTAQQRVRILEGMTH